jgi:Na+/H+ antiporter NhaD/arsenite permease-like protein
MVEWDMLLFFCAMFIMIEAAVELGLIDRIAQLLQLIINTCPPSAREVWLALQPHITGCVLLSQFLII